MATYRGALTTPVRTFGSFPNLRCFSVERVKYSQEGWLFVCQLSAAPRLLRQPAQLNTAMAGVSRREKR